MSLEHLLLSRYPSQSPESINPLKLFPPRSAAEEQDRWGFGSKGEISRVLRARVGSPEISTRLSTLEIPSRSSTLEAFQQPGRPERGHRPSERESERETTGYEPSEVSYFDRPLLSECGTYKTVTARFWPWVPGTSLQILVCCALFARTRGASMALLGSGCGVRQNGTGPTLARTFTYCPARIWP